MTFASLQAGGNTLSSRLKLKMWQIEVAISSAIILSNLPSKLSDPRACHYCYTTIVFSPLLHSFIICSDILGCVVSAFVAGMLCLDLLILQLKKIIKLAGNISWYCDE